MELSKSDTQKAQGLAALFMVMIHLFCRLGDLPYTPLIWLGDVPLIYYLGTHSTNIWLVHMFFYSSKLFPGLVFSAGYPVLILMLMMALCIASSVVINLVYGPLSGYWSRAYQRRFGAK